MFGSGVSKSVTTPPPTPPRLFELFWVQFFELPGGRGKDERSALLYGPGTRAWAGPMAALGRSQALGRLGPQAHKGGTILPSLPLPPLAAQKTVQITV